MLILECGEREVINIITQLFNLTGPDKTENVIAGVCLNKETGDFTVINEANCPAQDEQIHTVTRWFKVTGTRKGRDFKNVVLGICACYITGNITMLNKNKNIIRSGKNYDISLEIYALIKHQW